MIRLDRILVALDFSEHSQVAVRYAAELARAFSAEVVLCHVVEEAGILADLPPTGDVSLPPDIMGIREQRSRGEAERLLAESGIERGRVEIRLGRPYVEIVRLADEERADLIIVGTHGLGAIAHMLLGSVSEKVVRKAPCPVLTVRAGEHDFVMP